MWIRSQDKKFLIEATNIQYLEDCNVIVNSNDEDYTLLGKYSTEEKALNVLDMIQERLEPYKVVMSGNEYYVIPKDDGVFKMPQDNEVLL